MKNQGFNVLSFIQEKNSGISGFGVIADINTTDSLVYGMFANMEDNFGTAEVSVLDIEIPDEDAVLKTLTEISKNQEMYPWFIIQLNDIDELKRYHIKENDFTSKCRIKTNI